MEKPAPVDNEALSQKETATQIAPQEIMTPMIYHNIATAPQDFPTATMVQGVLLHTGKKKKKNFFFYMGSFFLNLFVRLLIRQYFSLSPTARNLYTNSKKKNFIRKPLS